MGPTPPQETAFAARRHRTCTLRAAIVEANAQSGANEVDFAIPGSGVQTIQLGSQLPTVTDTSGPTTIDGYTQPGASPNSSQFASNAQLRIALRGTGSHGIDALRITSPNNVVRGISFYNFRRSVWLAGGNAKGNRDRRQLRRNGSRAGRSASLGRPSISTGSESSSARGRITTRSERQRSPDATSSPGTRGTELPATRARATPSTTTSSVSLRLETGGS